MGKTVVSAPGKVLLTGAYLILERPYGGLVLSTSARFYTVVEPLHGELPADSWSWTHTDVQVLSPQLQRETSYKLRVKSGDLTPVDPASSAPVLGSRGNPLVERAVQMAVLGARCLLLKSAEGGGGAAQGGMPDLQNRLAKGLKITILGDNDFYSQRAVLFKHNLPLSTGSLASLEPRGPVSLTSAPSTPRKQVPAGDVFSPTAAKKANALPEIAKTGLGSSAAMVTSVVAALLQYLGALQLPTRDGELVGGSASSAPLDGLAAVHALAQAAHCAGQGKVGSGFDVSAAVFGSQRYVRFSPSLLGSLTDKPLDLSLRVLSAPWDEERSEYALPSGLVLVVGEPGAGGSSTPSMVGAVQKWRQREAEAAAEVWASLADANRAVEAGLASLRQLAASDPATWAAALAACASAGEDQWENLSKGAGAAAIGEALLATRAAFERVRTLLRKMGEEAGVPIEPPQQTTLLDATVQMPGVLLAGVPGAGGFDAVFAIVIGESTRERLEGLWGEHEVLALTVVEDARGVSRESDGLVT